MRTSILIITLTASTYAQQRPPNLRPISATPPASTSTLILQAEKELLQTQNLALQTQIMVMRAEQKLAEVRAQEEVAKHGSRKEEKQK